MWQALTDVERVSPCLPGAEINERQEDGSYKGTFTVKLGPTTASYRGTLRMEDLDEASHTATMRGDGTDKRGQGGVKATVVSRMREEGGVTKVDVGTDFTITGRLARFGRGGMVQDVSNRLLTGSRSASSSALPPATPGKRNPRRPSPTPDHEPQRQRDGEGAAARGVRTAAARAAAAVRRAGALRRGRGLRLAGAGAPQAGRAAAARGARPRLADRAAPLAGEAGAAKPDREQDPRDDDPADAEDQERGQGLRVVDQPAGVLAAEARDDGQRQEDRGRDRELAMTSLRRMETRDR